MKVIEVEVLPKDCADLKIGVVTSRFNSAVTTPLEQGTWNELIEKGVAENNIIAVRVPGAVEIPLAAKQLFEMGCDAVVTLGAVIRGETSHFDYVCTSVERGCTQLQLDYMKPVAFGVLTTETAEQAHARAGGAKGNKGAEAARTALEMILLQKKLMNN